MCVCVCVCVCVCGHHSMKIDWGQVDVKPQAYFTSEVNGGVGYFYKPSSLPLGTHITSRIG